MTTISETISQLTGAAGTLHLNADRAAESANKPASQPGPDYAYAKFLPSFDQNYKLPPLEPFEHVDPGHAALKDRDPRSFLEGATVNDLTPKFGTEVEGIQLSKLGDHDKRSVLVHPGGASS